MAGGVRSNLTARELKYIPTLVSTPLVVSTTPVSVPSTWVPRGSASAWICCDTLGGGVKFAADTPSTLWGRDLGPGDAIEVRDNIDLITRFKFVRTSGTDGKISFLFFTE